MARLELDVSDEGALIAKVTLSRRNLLSLLYKLDVADSKRTLTNRYCYVGGVLQDGILLVLRCEDDDAHYTAREEPGPMSADTEHFLDEQAGP